MNIVRGNSRTRIYWWLAAEAFGAERVSGCPVFHDQRRTKELEAMEMSPHAGRRSFRLRLMALSAP